MNLYIRRLCDGSQYWELGKDIERRWSRERDTIEFSIHRNTKRREDQVVGEGEYWIR